MNLALLLILALLIEAIITTLAWVVDSKFNWQRVSALVVAVLVAFLTGVDLFEIVGLPLKFPIIGPILTGLIMARGANALNDLFQSFHTIGKYNTKPAVTNLYPVAGELIEPGKLPPINPVKLK